MYEIGDYIVKAVYGVCRVEDILHLDISGADKQLRASEVFIEFLHKTAERLHQDFGDFSFNRKNIVLRKIIVKEVKSNKSGTQGTRVDKNQEIILFKSAGVFPLAKFL